MPTARCIEKHPVPELTREQIQQAFDKFKGDFYQTPPMVSAIKKNGVPLYKLARQGKQIEREPRFVRVYAQEIRDIRLPEIDFLVVCSKGFYVRTYAQRHRPRTGLRRAPERPATHEVRSI